MILQWIRLQLSSYEITGFIVFGGGRWVHAHRYWLVSLRFIGITHGFPPYPQRGKQETRKYLLPEEEKGKCTRHSCVLQLLFMNKRKWRPLEGGEVIIPKRVINIGEEKQKLERGNRTNTFLSRLITFNMASLNWMPSKGCSISRELPLFTSFSTVINVSQHRINVIKSTKE